MHPQRSQRLNELYHLALEHEPDQRVLFLAQACKDDEDLRREVELMIADPLVSAGTLDAQTLEGSRVKFETASVGGPSPWIPSNIGRYRILRVLGEGGMGTVYEAEQDNPRRPVALKVIKQGFASKEMLWRFDRESQVLAQLHHVGIAQIYEAGSAETGFGPQPYFAMEFIHGAPLRQYAELHQLNLRQRLELMAKLCEAVEHAHQHGIIHRDLKPSNILVDETGQPKILDFGVARVTNSDAQVTRQTDLGQLVGTLAYMSPEQVVADPAELDTRSDVYALGVILYELLANRLPYHLSDKLHEAVHTIREEDPTRLSSINRAYRGDLETIVGKALEKDKSRRYVSAAFLLGDIRKHLANQPITARPPTASYQIQKFVRRHKTLATATVIVFAVLIVGIVVSAREAIQARRAEETAQAVNDFLQNDLLAQAGASTQSGPTTKPDPDLKVRTALDRAAARISGKFDHQPEVEAAIRDTIGQTYMDLGLYAEARTHLERALELHRRTLGAKSPKTLATANSLGLAAVHQGRYPDAEALLSPTLDTMRRVLGADSHETLTSMNNLALVYAGQGKYPRAEALLNELLEARRRISGPEHPDTVKAMANLARVFFDEGKNSQAEALGLQTLEIQGRILGTEHPDTLVCRNNLAIVYYAEGKFAQAEALEIETLSIQQRVLGPEHLDTLNSMTNLSNTWASQGKYAQAEDLERKTLEIQRRVLGPEHPRTLMSMGNLADTLQLRGEYSQAIALSNENLEISRRVLGPEHPDTLFTLADLAFMYQLQGKYSIAESYSAQALKGRRRVLGPEHPDTIASTSDLALALVSQKKFVESEPVAREALELSQRNQPDDWQRFRAESLLGASLSGQKKYMEAEPLLIDGYQGMLARKERMGAPDMYHLDRARVWLMDFYKAAGRPEKAAQLSKK